MSELRIRRVERLLQEEIGSMITGAEVKHPKIDTLVRVTGTKVSRDFSYATIYISYYGERETTQEIVDALNHSAGFIQRTLNRRIRLRTIPKLHFVFDDSLERGFRITQKLKDL